MRLASHLAVLLAVVLATSTWGQRLMAAGREPGHLAGTVTDTNGDIIPGATVTIEAGANRAESVTANDDGFFQIDNIAAGTQYQVTVSAKVFRPGNLRHSRFRRDNLTSSTTSHSQSWETRRP